MVELIEGGNGLLAIFRVERAPELELNLLEFSQFEGFRAAEGALVAVLFDAGHALVAKGLAAHAPAEIGLVDDIVADGAFVLEGLFCSFNEVFGFVCLHKYYKSYLLRK